ncbi:unnamed protein product [Schistocephalus solidus]|uniref:BPTI/Kunitz inhibitor domain-containing protein n=1 Tax=Schistocephalus solidus TaxID=70667 RepID=A0A183T0C4_SCHSO|nr:unnamed protein product [Schistocephalus solidus]
MRKNGAFEDAAVPMAEAEANPSSSLRYGIPDVAENDEQEEKEGYQVGADSDYDQDLIPKEVDYEGSQLDDGIEEIEEKSLLEPEEVEEDNADLTTDKAPIEVKAGIPTTASLPDGPIIVPEVRWTEGRGVLAGLPPTDEPYITSTESTQAARLSGSKQESQVAANDGPEDLSSEGREVDAMEREQPAWEENDANVVFNIDEPERDYVEKVLSPERVYEAVEQDFVDTSNPIRRSQPSWPKRSLTALGARPRHPACLQPLDMGVGPEELSSWYYDTGSRTCFWFPYAGHGGNANRFYTRTACQDLCVFENLATGPRQSIESVVDQVMDPARFLEVEGRILPPECSEPLDQGNCDQRLQLSRYYYSEESNSCLFFLFRGCGGNNNRFKSKSECMNYCAL